MMASERFYWIKLRTDFFDMPEIDWLFEQKNGCEYIVLYQRLCTLAANTGGDLIRSVGEMMIPYDAKKISELTRFKLDTVIVALELFKKCKLIMECENGIISICNFENMVGSESKAAEKKRKYEQNKLPPLKSGTCKRVNREILLLPNGKKQYIDEQRYGGNGAVAFDNAKCQCEMCGCGDDLLIHHNNGYSNEPEDLYVLCKKCHGIAHSAEFGGNLPPKESLLLGRGRGGDFPPNDIPNGIPEGGSNSRNGGGDFPPNPPDKILDIDIRDRYKEIDIDINNNNIRAREGENVDNSVDNDGFASFWESYPKKAGNKELTRQLYHRILSLGVLGRDLLHAAIKYTMIVRTEKREETYIKTPYRFLADKKFLDYVPALDNECSHCHGNGYYELERDGSMAMQQCSCRLRFDRVRGVEFEDK